MVSTQITRACAHEHAAVRLCRCVAFTALMCGLLVQAANAQAAAAAPRLQRLQQELHTQLDTGSERDADNTAERSAIADFYRQRDFAPVWMDTKRLMELGQLTKLAELHGLDARDYYLNELAQRINALLYTDGDAELIQLELLATRSVTRLAGHLAYGKTNPGALYGIRQQTLNAPTAQQLLSDAAVSESLFAYLDSLPPDTLIYRKLQLRLAQHRAQLNAGQSWPTIDNGRTLEPGMRDPRVQAVRERLGLPENVANPDIYDADTVTAVLSFQAQHALPPDGLLGPQTRRALNVTLQQRINQLRVNMEWQRWAGLSDDIDYLRVNIPHYTLSWIEQGTRVWSMRTQVGKRKRQTPVFKSAVNAIMANPAWTVPPTIFREDILPRLQLDPDYLDGHGMYVVDKRGRPVDSSNIDWRQTTANEFPYRVRARPSMSNALGKLKFLIPNPHLIYLHDTPAKHLFEQTNRAVSSGCIRVEKPEQLAEFLVARQHKTSPGRLVAAMSADATRYIGLDEPVPIVVTYATIDLDDHGRLVFARDIYRKDAKVLAALDAPQTGADRLFVAGLAPATKIAAR